MQNRRRMCSAMLPSSLTSTVVIPTWNVLSSIACSKPADCTLATQLLWCMKCNTKYNLIFWLAAQQSGSLRSHSQPVQCLSVFAAAAAPRGSSAWVCHSERMTLGTSVLALSHRGNPLLSPLDHPRRRRVVCHPVPIDNTRGCGSPVLFIGLSHPRLLPRPICVTLAQRRRI